MGAENCEAENLDPNGKQRVLTLFENVFVCSVSIVAKLLWKGSRSCPTLHFFMLRHPLLKLL